MKSKIVHVRFKEEDYENLLKAAEKNNKKLSEYVRQVMCDTIKSDIIPIEQKFPWLRKVKQRS